jgi:hypothetical protein
MTMEVPTITHTTTFSFTVGAASKMTSKVRLLSSFFLFFFGGSLPHPPLTSSSPHPPFFFFFFFFFRPPPPFPSLGHDNRWENNVVAFISSYCIHNGYGGNMDPVLPGHEQHLINNTCIINHDGDYGLPICKGDDKSVLGGNSVFSPTGKVTECGMPLAAWQALGNDPGTTASAYTSTLPADTIAKARALIMV